MRAKPADIKQVIDMQVRYLVDYLCEVKNMTVNEAFSAVIRSRTYADLMDTDLKYYRESKEYILDMFISELSSNTRNNKRRQI